MDDLSIRPADGAEDFAAARELFVEYAEGLGVDLCFQGFAQELDAVATHYAPPSGRLLLARRGATPVGCVAYRARDGAECEMRRLYVRPTERGRDTGRALAEAIVDAARADGYRSLVLHTLDSMVAARGLYASLGFTPRTPYDASPVPGAVYLTLDLTSVSPSA